MPLILLSSPKGGVGVTTLAAELAVAMALMGREAIALDAHPADGLRLHFGDVDPAASDGWSVDPALAPRDVEAGCALLPHGRPPERGAATSPDRVVAHLTAARPDAFVIVDCGRDAAAVLAPSADLRIEVVEADAACFRMRGSLDPGEDGRACVVLNRHDSASPMERDVRWAFEAVLGERLFGTVRRDAAFREAAAHGGTAIGRDPESAGAADVAALAASLAVLFEDDGAST